MEVAKVFTILSLTVALISCSPQSFPDLLGRSFHGVSVYRVEARTTNEFDAVVKLYEGGTLDFWTRPRLKGFTDIMVTREQEFELLDYCTNHSIQHRVMIPDVEKMAVKERQANAEKKGPGIDWNAYYRLGEIHSWMDSLATSHPNLVKIQSIGRSSEGRDMKLIKISKGGGERKPAMFMDATFHAREWIAGATATYVINQLVTNASAYAFLQDIDVHILPIVNPDGYEWSHTNDRMWRKTRSDRGSSRCRGVDPNRNFGYHWGGLGTSTEKCSEIFKGPHSFSEPETQAVRDYILSPHHNFKAYITIHSYSQLWLTPWGYTSDYPTDYVQLESLGLKAVAAVEKPYGTIYEVGSSTNILYAAAGGSDDWAKGSANVKYAYTTELRDTGRYGFMLPPNQIIPAAHEAWLGYQVIANHIAKNP